MKNSCEKDLLGFVLGALEASEQREIQEAIDNDPQLEEQLVAIKNGIAPLDYLDSSGHPPGLARRTCELVASIGQPPHRCFNPQAVDSLAATNPRSKSLLEALVQETLADTTSDIEAEHPIVHSVATLKADRPDSASSLQPGLKATPASDIQCDDSTEKIDSAVEPAKTESRWLWHKAPFSFTDLAFGIGFLAILAGVLLPAVSYTRHQSRLLHCQNNLREIGNALHQYSQIHQGRFVEIPRSGPLSVVGAFAPILKDAGLIEDDSVFGCAGAAVADSDRPVRIPSLTIIQQAERDELLHLQKSFSGHYGYTMGYVTQTGHSKLPNLGRSYVVLVSDAPSLNRVDRISSHHAGRGQNCLFEDGRVEFVVGGSYGEDALFFNDYHQVAPGCRPGDNVIAPSHLSPVFAVSIQ